MGNGLSLGVLLAVLGAGVLHAVWNAIAKAGDDRLITFGLIGVVGVIGGGFVLVCTGMPDNDAVWFALISAAIHIGYNVGLMQSYRLGAFNQTYPLARGTAPLVVAVGASVFAHERLSGVVLAGVLILATGLMSLALSSGTLSRREFPAVVAALLTGLTIAAYTIVDGLGVRRGGNPLAYAGVLFLMQGVALTLMVAVRRPPASWKHVAVGPGLAAGFLSLAAYAIVLWAQTEMPLAEVSALRETSVISAAVIGAVLMKERFGARRATAAVMVAAGIVLMSI